MKKLIKLTLMCLACLPVIAAGSSSSAFLQFRLVADGPSQTAEKMTLSAEEQGTSQQKTFFVEKPVLLDQTMLNSVRVTRLKPDDRPCIELTFTDAGKARFAEVTRENVGRQLAIIIDGQLYSAPVIQAEVKEGKAVISGNFSQEEVDKLASELIHSLEN